jgi:hypothetical protein
MAFSMNREKKENEKKNKIVLWHVIGDEQETI